MTVVPLHSPAADEMLLRLEAQAQARVAREECLANLASISTLIQITTRGEHLQCAREFLAGLLEDNYQMLEALNA